MDDTTAGTALEMISLQSVLQLQKSVPLLVISSWSSGC